ncbi:MAG: glycosyltransferase family 39 protein, partial [archaeon]|nr:glycosyltransferase family 39 protein [archaeon]
MDIEKRVIIEIIAIILAIKFFSFTLAPLSWAVLKNQPCDIISLWNRWDVSNYVYIAENGYTDVGEGRYFIVFLPLYPFLIRLLASVIGHYEVSALLISNIASLFAGVYLYKLAKIDYSHSTALKSVFYLSIFPTSYFLIAGYTESLFLFLTIGCFFYAMKGNWLPAGVMGMLASATRITGLVLIPSLVYEFLS